ncbi:MFS transporter (plasmid) [Embleya sp. NBC_00888]|uniref:MFS transporter n=1 Tax=Embleya sp. NBC_00888 TaxID=2975960 RepID=UPI002F90B997|nr:MFS transporter [Embleya sp. NBC_00888]
MALSAADRTGTGHVVLARARRAAIIAFAAQGMSVAAVFTTVPAVTERLRLAPLPSTGLMVAVALMAGVGSYLGLAAIRRVGPLVTTRGAPAAAAVALTLIGWAPGHADGRLRVRLLRLAVGSLDVGANTRAAAIERAYRRSVFGSFYAAWSVGGVAAMLTAASARLEWPAARGLDVQAVVLLVLVACIRTHPLPSSAATPDASAQPPTGGRLWRQLLPFGLVLPVVYVVDSTVSAWSAVYLRRALGASLTVAPMAYAAYQAGTVVGRAGTDRLVHRFGASVVVRGAAVLVASALAGMAAAPSWPFAVLAAGAVGVGASALAPLCLASAARLRPGASEAVLARLNLQLRGRRHGRRGQRTAGFHGAVPLAYAVPAAVAVCLLAGARHFAAIPRPACAEDVVPVARAEPRQCG